MLDDDIQTGSNGSNATTVPVSRKRKADRAPDSQSPALFQHGGHVPRLKRLARKPTPENDQQASSISSKSPRLNAPQALTGLTWERSNKPSRAPVEPAIAEVDTLMTVASGGPGGQHYTDAVLTPIPIHGPDMMLDHSLNGEEVLPPGLLDPFPLDFLATFKTPSPDLHLVNRDPHLTQGGNFGDASVPSAPEVKRTRQQISGSRSLECPWCSVLEKMVSVELIISKLSGNANSPLQQPSPERFEMLLEDCMELRQRYIYLRKSVQNSKRSCE